MASTAPIDIDPVKHSSDRDTTKQSPGTDPSAYYTYGKDAPAGSASQNHQTTTYQTPHYGAPRTTTAATATSPKGSGRIGSAVQVAAGGAIALVGIPMLVLPGPGLLAIGGGLALAAGGVKKLMGK